MSAIDLHPEELLDRLGRGSLSALETQRLAAHCASCLACRAELYFRRAQGAGQPDVQDVALADAVVSRMLDRVSPPKRAKGLQRRALAAVAASAVLGSAFTVAAMVPSFPQQVMRAVAALTAEIIPQARQTRSRATKATDKPAPPASELPSTAPAEAVAAVVPSPQPALQHAVSPPRSKPAPTARPTSTRREQSTAEALLEAATSARLTRDFVAAAALYARLEREHPESASCHAARISYARLLCSKLDRPSDALTRFDAYLQASPHGPLLEEALSGKAQCLSRLGQRTTAADVWRELLRVKPESLYAKEARRALSTP